MKIYISGPMTGLPAFNYPAFERAAAILRAGGHDVENPAENVLPPGSEWSAYMHHAIPRLLTCSAVALLPGWQTSKGAQLEVMIAEALGLLILPPGTWGNVDDMVLADVDRYLELVLNAAGTSLRNYSMQRSLDNMRGAMRQALVCRLFLLTDEAAANTILRASGSSLDVFPAHEQEVILQVIAGVRKAALEQC